MRPHRLGGALFRDRPQAGEFSRAFMKVMDSPNIHVYDVSMRKIQVLFPEPQLRRLRELARAEDRPVSEIIRRATEEYLARIPASDASTGPHRVPVFDGGRTFVGAERLRDIAYDDRTGTSR